MHSMFALFASAKDAYDKFGFLCTMFASAKDAYDQFQTMFASAKDAYDQFVLLWEWLPTHLFVMFGGMWLLCRRACRRRTHYRSVSTQSHTTYKRDGGQCRFTPLGDAHMGAWQNNDPLLKL